MSTDYSQVIKNKQEKMDKLLAEKEVKLNEQSKLALEFNDYLTRNGGFLDAADETLRNLNVGIAVSQRPGYFKYFKLPEELKEIQKKGEFKRLTKEIKQVQIDLDRINHQIDECNKEYKRQVNAMYKNLPQTNGLEDWFKIYGTPSKPLDPGMYSSFKQSDRVYGQTHYHKAFRSTATKLIRGRCTQ